MQTLPFQKTEKYINLSGKFSGYTPKSNADDREKRMKDIHLKNKKERKKKTQVKPKDLQTAES